MFTPKNKWEKRSSANCRIPSVRKKVGSTHRNDEAVTDADLEVVDLHVHKVGVSLVGVCRGRLGLHLDVEAAIVVRVHVLHHRVLLLPDHHQPLPVERLQQRVTSETADAQC